MFSEAVDSVAEPVAVEELPPADEPEVEHVAVAAVPPSAAAAPEPAEIEVIALEEAVPKKAAKKATTRKASAKTDGRAASWQKYTRPGVKNESIPNAVRLILETQPEKDFKIAEVMAALFQEDMPKAQYLKARNRISNVLSGGVRAGDWHRGERSTYCLSAA